jgi:hypothetical protein
MARFAGPRCSCGQPAIGHHKIKKYRDAGRLSLREYALLIPRADMPPRKPMCVYCLVRWLGASKNADPKLKRRFWNHRRRWKRNTSQVRRRVCVANRTNGVPCSAPAMAGSKYCHAHDPRTRHHWCHRLLETQKPCKCIAISTGKPCRRRTMRGMDVCYSHGGKGARAAAYYRAHPDPAGAPARKRKQQRHVELAKARQLGLLPPLQPNRESDAHMQARLKREEAAYARRGLSSGTVATNMRAAFEEGTFRERRPQKLRPLYGGW